MKTSLSLSLSGPPLILILLKYYVRLRENFPRYSDFRINNECIMTSRCIHISIYDNYYNILQSFRELAVDNNVLGAFESIIIIIIEAVLYFIFSYDIVGV